MSKVRWFIDKNPPSKSRAKYVETSLSNILLDWDDTSTGRLIDMKVVKIKLDNNRFINFNIYNSDNYTKRVNKMYQNVPIVHGKLQAVISNATLKRKVTPQDTYSYKNGMIDLVSAHEKLDSFNLPEVRPENFNWYSVDELNEILLEVQDMMENLEMYEVTDLMLL